jgi:HD superfamily phosphohydrolase
MSAYGIFLVLFCDSIGHGAFSHVWDNLFMRSYVAELNPDKQKWSHEDGSIFMLQHLLKSNNIDLKVYGLDADGSGRDQASSTC